MANATPMLKSRWGCSAAVVNQRLYVAGGCHANNVLSSVECFDAAGDHGRWVLVKPMLAPRWGQFLVSCDGKLFAVGGGTANRPVCAESYDPSTNEWHALPGFISGPRWGSACTAVGQHQLAVVGGLDVNGRFLATVEFFAVGDYMAGWRPGPSLSVPRAGHAVVHIEGQLFCAGGRDSDGALQSVERLRLTSIGYDPRGMFQQEGWQHLPALRVPRSSPAAVVCDGQLLVIGGMNSDTGFLESCEAYDSLLQKWEPRMPMHHARSACAVALVDAGVAGKQIWAAGGGTAQSGGSRVVEVYELVGKKWQVSREHGDHAPPQCTQLSAGPFDHIHSFDTGIRAGRSVVVPGREGLIEIASGRRPKSGNSRRIGPAGKTQLNSDGLAYSMVQEKSTLDKLELYKHPAMQQLFAECGDREVLTSEYIEEMDANGKWKRRAICVTDTQVYDLDPKEYKLYASAPLHSLALVVTMSYKEGMLLAFEKGNLNSTKGPTIGKLKGKSGRASFLCFACEQPHYRSDILRLLDRHTPNAVSTVECNSQREVLPMIQQHPVLAGSPLTEWFVEAQHSDFDAYGFDADGAAASEQWRKLKYSNRVDQQRADWQKFIKKYQTQLRSAESSGPRVRFDEGGREYTDSGSAKALVVPKKLVRNGLPPEQRGEIWQVMSGSAAKRSSGRGQYNSLVRRYAGRQSAATQQIDRDLSRTFPDNTVYQSSTGRAKLRRVLVAFSWRNRSVAYAQSMSYIAALLLLFMDEEPAFWLLCTVIEELLPAGFYDKMLSGLQLDIQVLIELVAEKFPKLTAHLDALLPSQDAHATGTVGGGSEQASAAPGGGRGMAQCMTIVGPHWLACLFVGVVPTESVLRLWDCFFREGSKVLFRFGLALLRAFEAQLRSCRSFEEAVMLMKDGMKADAKAADPDRLLDLAFGKHMDPWGLSAARIHALRKRFGDAAQHSGGAADMPPASPLSRYGSRTHWADDSVHVGSSSDEEEVGGDEHDDACMLSAAPVADFIVESSKLGFSFVEVASNHGTTAVFVKSIDKNSVAAECDGLVPGLMLQEIDGRSTVGVSFAEVERRLKPRPIHLVFGKAQ